MSNNLVVASSDDPKGSVMGPSDVGDIELCDSVGKAKEIFAMPHIYDSVVLILLSVRSHIGFAPCIVTKSASAKVISDGKFGLGSY